MRLSDFLLRHAETVATVAHYATDHTRKYTGEAYIEHPRRVVELVKTSAALNHEMIAAAWLHDVVEDTAITVRQIEEWFGKRIAAMVAALTNVETEVGNRRQRFEINRDRLKGASALVKTIKVCDLIDNTSTIVKHDPKFAALYLAEKRELLETALIGADPQLWNRAWDICLAGQMELSNEP